MSCRFYELSISYKQKKLILYIFYTYICKMKSKRYKQIHLSIPETAMNEMRKECFNLRISQQEFMRSLIRDYFLRRKGMDIYLQTRETLKNDNN